MIAPEPVAESRGPGATAEMAAEAVRTLNRRTLVAPCRGAPGWEDVADLYRVLAEVRILVERLPQALDQLARHLQRPGPEGYRCDGGTTATSDDLVSRAVDAIGVAQGGLMRAGRELAEAQSAVAHLAPRPDDGW